MPIPEKVERNKEIRKRYKPHKVGYKKLGQIYNVDWTVIRDIVKAGKKVGEKTR